MAGILLMTRRIQRLFLFCSSAYFPFLFSPSSANRDVGKMIRKAVENRGFGAQVQSATVNM
ncbi:MAG: hypothetical protein LAT81_02200 [Oceanicaulis sp.]|nr:hypothetical protein [Oceanicaulis sp.]